MKRLAILVLLVSLPSWGQKKGTDVPCVHHFNVVQYDQLENETVGLTAEQLNWYKGKLEKKFPYVCYDPSVNTKSTQMGQGQSAEIFLITVSSTRSSGTQTVQSTEQVETSGTGTVTDSDGNVSTVNVQGASTVPVTKSVPYSETDRNFLLGIYFPSEDGKLKRFRMFSRLQARQHGGDAWTAIGTNLRERHPDHDLIEDAVKFLSTGK